MPEKRNGKPRSGEQHPHARLTNHEVELVRQFCDEKMPYRTIAEKMEISYDCVKSICTYRRRSTD
jgi:predicted DNA-binding protein (UPF0251 family)